jgi:hypothetical protein
LQRIWRKGRLERESGIDGFATQRLAVISDGAKGGREKNGGTEVFQRGAEKHGGIETKEAETPGILLVKGDVAFVVKFADAVEGERAEVKIKELLAKGSGLVLDEEGFGLFAEIAQESQELAGQIRAHEMTVARLPSVLFGELEEARIESSKKFGAAGKNITESGFKREDFILEEFGGEHFTSAIDEVVGFVDEKGEIATLAGKVALERDGRVERVIVVADHAIGPDGEIERKLEGADLVFARQGFYFSAGENLPME